MLSQAPAQNQAGAPAYALSPRHQLAQIAATGDGSKAATPDGKSALAQYRAAMLKEIELTLSVTELAVRRTDAIARNAVDAISSATRLAAKASKPSP